MNASVAKDTLESTMPAVNVQAIKYTTEFWQDASLSAFKTKF